MIVALISKKLSIHKYFDIVRIKLALHDFFHPDITGNVFIQYGHFWPVELLEHFNEASR